jgi:serine/threonine-protein kinase
MVMEYWPGETLDTKIWQWQQGEGLYLDTAARIAREIGDALLHLESLGIVHGDISARNIIIGTEGTPKLIDFSSAGYLADLKSGRGDRIIHCRAHYVPPELILHQALSRQFDQYSFGVTLFKLVTGGFPYDGETDDEIIERVRSDRAPFARRVNPNVPDELNGIINRLMSKHPEERFWRTAELVDSLQNFQSRATSRNQIVLGGDEAGEKVKRTPSSGSKVGKYLVIISIIGLLIVLAVWAANQ